MLTELVGDKSLERFRQEYEKLHRALKKSHESEKRLIKKCRELNAEIVSNAAKVSPPAARDALSARGDAGAGLLPSTGALRHPPEPRPPRLIGRVVSGAAVPPLQVQTALKLSQEDQNTIGSLKREIEKVRSARACARAIAPAWEREAWRTGAGRGEGTAWRATSAGASALAHSAAFARAVSLSSIR